MWSITYKQNRITWSHFFVSVFFSSLDFSPTFVPFFLVSRVPELLTFVPQASTYFFLPFFVFFSSSIFLACTTAWPFKAERKKCSADQTKNPLFQPPYPFRSYFFILSSFCPIFLLSGFHWCMCACSAMTFLTKVLYSLSVYLSVPSLSLSVFLSVCVISLSLALCHSNGPKKETKRLSQRGNPDCSGLP